MATLEFRRGDTVVYTAALVKNDGTPLDLTGATVWMTVKVNYGGLVDDSDAIFKWYWVYGGGSSGLSVATPANGQVTLTILPTDTLGKQIGTTWKYDIQVKLASGAVYTWDEGTIALKGDITQRITVP